MSKSPLADGFHPVPPGRIATIVTHLEMDRPAKLPVPAFPAGTTLIDASDISAAAYRDLFRAVGSDWLWFSRLSISEADLLAILRHPQVEVHVLAEGQQHIGLLELDFRMEGLCELAFFGLVSGAVGKGLGKALMATAITRAFSGPRQIKKLIVHTCTLDHPNALGFYRHAGFMPTRQEVEIALDPRLDGRLPETAAAQVPMFGE
jgi:GNAT superfamily N-acetyltransferase